ncbi:MAG: hypothetical protein PHP54_05325 [Clostridia bacterium]|nr:hypothetical protein [Clostridia bacterium]
MNKRNNGISLIVLVITIAIMVIIAAAVIITLNNQNPIENAKESTFKSNIRQMYEELNIYISDMNSTTYGEFDSTKLSADATSVTYTGRGVEIKEQNIKEIITVLHQLPKYDGIVSIVNGKLTLAQNKFSDNEKKWFEEVLGNEKL